MCKVWLQRVGKVTLWKHLRHNLNTQLFGNKTDHAKQRQSERNIDDRAIEHAKKNAIHISKIYYNDYGEPCKDYIGFKITTIVNPETNVVITTYRTPTSIRKKYKKKWQRNLMKNKWTILKVFCKRTIYQTILSNFQTTKYVHCLKKRLYIWWNMVSTKTMSQLMMV